MYKFHDPKLAELAEIAEEARATAYAGGWVQLLNWANPNQSAAVTAKSTYTTIADICNPQTNFIPANSLQTGSQLHFHAWGSYGSAAGTATTTMGLYLNGAASGTQLVISASATPPTSTVNLWVLDVYATVLTVGSAGTIQPGGYILGLGATTTTPILLPATLPAATTINTTQANSVTIAASWNTSAAGNTYSVYGYDVELFN